jgi:hypothetical protein
MGYASRGGSCPLCGNYASRTATDKLYRHKGNVSVMIGVGYRECRASGVLFEVAQRMRVNKDAGRHPHHNEDGSWLYVCSRCGREQHPWPLDRGPRPKCAPARWAHCIRELSQLQTTEARNEK